MPVTNGNHWQFEDLTCDWSENNEHFRHILGVHVLSSFTVNHYYFLRLALLLLF